MTKATALRKSIHVFEGLRRMLSMNENGLVPDKGCLDSFQAIDETIQVLKEMLREMQASGYQGNVEMKGEYAVHLKKWQKDIIEDGAPAELRLL